MAGHSKWGNTKHRKAIQDAKRSKIFSKIIREVTSAIKLGGSDPHSNSRLRAAIDKALSNNMTRDTVNRTIMRCIGDEGVINIENIIYEGYGPGGSAILVECLTNNRKRTVSEIRCAFNSVGGNLGTNGSVSYLFSRKGVISFKSDQNEDKFLEVILKTGVEDVIKYDNGMIDVFTLQEELYSIYDELDKLGLKADSTKYLMIPSIRNQLNSENTKKLLNLIDLLEKCEDVQEIHHNGEFFK